MTLEMRLTVCIFTCLFVGQSVSGASLSQDLSNGVCLCINEPNVVAVSDPNNPSTVLATLSNGACFTSHGGVTHLNSITYYQLVDSGQTAWVDAFYLSIVSMSHCDKTTTVIDKNYHTPEGQAASCVTYGRTYIHGEQFLVDGLQCTCDDGATICTMKGLNCFSGGIVYQHGTAFEISGRGSCTCHNNHVNCNSAVGK